jgi:hypothetical protein
MTQSPLEPQVEPTMQPGHPRLLVIALLLVALASGMVAWLSQVRADRYFVVIRPAADETFPLDDGQESGTIWFALDATGFDKYLPVEVSWGGGHWVRLDLLKSLALCDEASERTLADQAPGEPCFRYEGIMRDRSPGRAPLTVRLAHPWLRWWRENTSVTVAAVGVGP